MLTIRTAAFALIALLSACTQRDASQSASPEIQVQPVLAQCGKDTDCKGDRICDSGSCIAPQGANRQPLPEIGENEISALPAPAPSRVNSPYSPLLSPNGQVTLGRCHMSSCSWAKWRSVKPLISSASQQVLQVTLLGGDSAHDEVEDYPSSPKGVAINWNAESHNVKVTCSHTEPAVSDDVLSLNPETGVYGAQESAAQLYFVACHSYFGGYPNGVRKFGYNVKEQDY